MKNRSLMRITLCLAFALAAVLAFTAAAYADIFTEQMKDGYYEISQPVQLFELGRHQGAKYRLTADIDMAGYTWTPVDFFGELDGGGHAIRNLDIKGVSGDVRVTFDGNMKRYATSFSGFFGVLENAWVHDLDLEGVTLVADEGDQCVFAGLLAGWMTYSTVENVRVSGRGDLYTTSKSFGIGGFAGFGKGQISYSEADTVLVCVDRDKEHRDEQFMGGAYAAGCINVDNCTIIIDGYDSDHGYVHNGGIVGMYIQYEKNMPKGSISHNRVEGRIKFFEDNRDRRAYCAPYGGEMMSWNLVMDGNSNAFTRDETKDYSKDLYPEE